MAETEKDFTVHSYLESLSNKKLMGSKCKNCGEIYAPPRKLCIKCNTAEMEWLEFSGNGEVVAFSCIGVGSKFFADKGYNIRNPYCFSVVKLDEGPMISGQLIGVNEVELQKKPPAEVIGTKVKVKFIETPIPGDTARVDLGFEPA